MKKGKLFILTGINGAGKDENMTRVQALLEAEGIAVQAIYGPKISERTTAIRAQMLNEDLCPKSLPAQALMWFAQHFETAREVKMLLDQGVTVLLNRGPETTFVYNVLDRKKQLGEPMYEVCRQIYALVLEQFNVARIIYLDIDAETAIERAGQQGETDHFQQDLDAFERRIAAYMAIKSSVGDFWHIIDARPPIEEVAAAITKYIMEVMEIE